MSGIDVVAGAAQVAPAIAFLIIVILFKHYR